MSAEIGLCQLLVSSNPMNSHENVDKLLIMSTINVYFMHG
jgi:hypothetical protein